MVWVWGSARSGSTWLLQMLTHPLKLNWSDDAADALGFVAPGTWQGTVDAIPVDTTFVGNHLLPTSGQAGYSADLAPLTFGSALGLGKRANYFFSSKYEDAWRPELRRDDACPLSPAGRASAERYEVQSPLMLLKEVDGVHGAPLVMSMFPRSKLVFLVRDGRDVIDSKTAATQPGGWMPVNGWTTPRSVASSSGPEPVRWVGTCRNRAGVRAPFGRARQVVRYEDLLASPAEHVGLAGRVARPP